MRPAKAEVEAAAPRIPIRGTYPTGCCASTRMLRTKSMAQRVRTVIVFFMTFFVLPLDTRHSALVSLDNPSPPASDGIAKTSGVTNLTQRLSLTQVATGSYIGAYEGGWSKSPEE